MMSSQASDFAPNYQAVSFPFYVITFFHGEFMFSNFCLFVFIGINHQELPVSEVVTAYQK